MVDKKKELPVFDKDCDKYQKHRKIESDYEHCKTLFNNGKAPPFRYAGILGTESCNSLIKQYVILLIFYINFTYFYHFINIILYNFLHFIFYL